MKFCLALLLLCLPAAAQEWRETLSKTPFKKTHFQAYRTEPVDLILKSFKPSAEMRGVVLMPGAADQLYFFDWGKIELGKKPTLLQALDALTNKASLRYTFVAPFLLIHMDRDPTSDPLTIQADAPERFQSARRKGKSYLLDRPYDRVLKGLEETTQLTTFPDARSTASWHWYRLSFIGYNLSAADLLRAIAYGAKTTVTVERERVAFKDRPFQL